MIRCICTIFLTHGTIEWLPLVDLNMQRKSETDLLGREEMLE